MKILTHDDIMCMANVRGKDVRTPCPLPFSFYFSEQDGSRHAIRVKVTFNPNRTRISNAGTLKLHGDWEFSPSSSESHVSSRDIEGMKEFFKQYKVLFAAVWEGVLDGKDVERYFEGSATIHDVVEALDIYESDSHILNLVSNVPELEAVVRENDLFNMRD